jgi:cytochrome c-type biogenesis protein CcmF
VNPLDSFQPAPAWGFTVGMVGRALVFTGIGLFLLAAAAALLGRHNRFERLSLWAVAIGALTVVLVMGCLIALLLGQQYQYLYVFNNTTRDMPAVYRFSAAWAAQEGSFLLWTMMSAVFTTLALRRVGALRRWYTVVGCLFLAAMLAIVAYESPFRIPGELVDANGQIRMPPTGTGLNPVLQNYWMAIHPWVIFIGFGSLLALFSWAAAAAIAGDRKDWVLRVRPWAVFSMLFLGVGLTMGGLWAYETLGWGGFWAWDPVENVSLVPFLTSAAFVHVLYLCANRGVAPRWAVALGLIPFLTFVYGTYLTRSGALVNVSVHSFAKMTEGAHGVLAGIVIATILGTLALAALAFKKGEAPPGLPPGARGWGMAAGVVLLYLIAVIAGAGMSRPFFSALGGGSAQVVAEADYNRFTAIPYLAAMLLLAVVPFLGWKRTRSERWGQIANVFLVAVLLFGVIALGLVFSGLTLDAPTQQESLPLVQQLSRRPQLLLFFLLIFTTVFAITGNAWRMVERIRARSGGWAGFLTHIGVAVLLLGLIVSRAFEKSATAVITPSQPQQLVVGPAGYLAMLSGLPGHEEVFTPECTVPIRMESLSDRFHSWTAQPVFFYEPMAALLRGELRPVTRPYIKRTFLYDLYLAIGEPSSEFLGEFTMKPGEVKEFEDGQIQVKYVAATREGEPGKPGTKFGAQLLVSYEGREFSVNPQLILTDSGMQREGAPVGVDFLASLERLDAATQEATLRLDFQEPYVFTQLFFKPLTGLVWLGAGIMTLGGVLAIRQVGRRAPKPTDASDEAAQV